MGTKRNIMFYSKSSNGFYSIEINGDNIPSDAVEISEEDYSTLLAGQSEGKVITADENGYPILVDAPASEITIVSMRQARLALLQEDQLDAVEAMITTREQHIWWDYSATVEKYNPLVTQIKTVLGWTDEYLTQLFELAATL